jgi:hypothetical protein
MVGRQAMGMNRKQQPQLFGDADRVLVGRWVVTRLFKRPVQRLYKF